MCFYGPFTRVFQFSHYIPVRGFGTRFVNVLVYYGLSLGVSRLGMDLYLTQFVFGLIEIPARTLVLVVLPCSRRLSQAGFLAAGGLACLLMLAVPAGIMDPPPMYCVLSRRFPQTKTSDFHPSLCRSAQCPGWSYHGREVWYNCFLFCDLHVHC